MQKCKIGPWYRRRSYALSLLPDPWHKPLLLTFVGRQDTAESFEQQARLSAWGDARGFSVAHCQTPWYRGWRAGGPYVGNPDIAYFLAVLTELRQRLTFDHKRLWLAGFGDGGTFASYAADYVSYNVGALVLHHARIPSSWQRSVFGCRHPVMVVSGGSGRERSHAEMLGQLYHRTEHPVTIVNSTTERRWGAFDNGYIVKWLLEAPLARAPC